MRSLWTVLSVFALVLPVWAQAGAAQGVFQIDFSNAGLVPSHWVLTLHPDGSGHFLSERGSAPPDPAEGLQAPGVDRDIQVSAEFAQRVFETARQQNFFNEDCESHLKMAFQGWKKLSYSGSAGRGNCKYNYSKNKEIEEFGDSLIAVAETILEGSRLEVLLKHDRLGLDKEMEYMVEAAKDGRLQQFSTIRSILERLADDDEVLDRVRNRAKMLLKRAET